MKKIYLLVVLFCIVQFAFGQGVKFEKGNLEEALKKAKMENKMVFIDAFAVWCGPCKWMSQNTFKDVEVGKYFDKHIVALKVDVERGEGIVIKQKYAIEGLPGYLFLDSDGVVIFRESGSMSVEKFMQVVKQAQEYADDPNSVGRMSARYLSEKENESFLKLYLERLIQSHSKGYFSVLEDYLKVQTSMQPSDGAMALFLAKHQNSIVFGGEADRIIEENYLTEGWRKVVRKDIREVYQRLPKYMAEQTLNYSVQLRDTAIIGTAMRRLAEEGVNYSEDQRDKLLIYYYLHTKNGKAYKKLQLPVIENFVNSLDIESLKESHRQVLQSKKENPDAGIRSHAVRITQQLKAQAEEFAQFVKTDQEKKMVIEWASIVYDLIPDEIDNVNFYANFLYLFGDKLEALKIKEKALQMSEGLKMEETIKLQLDDMKAGRAIKL